MADQDEEEVLHRIDVWNRTPTLHSDMDMFVFLRANLEWVLEDHYQLGIQEYVKVEGFWQRYKVGY